MTYEVEDILNAIDGTDADAQDAPETDIDARDNAETDIDAQDAPETGNPDQTIAEIMEEHGVDTLPTDTGDTAAHAARVAATGIEYVPSIESQDMVSRMVAAQLGDDADEPTQAEIDRVQSSENTRYQNWLLGNGSPGRDPLVTGMSQVLRDLPMNSTLAIEARDKLSHIVCDRYSSAVARQSAVAELSAYRARTASELDSRTTERLTHVRTLADSARGISGAELSAVTDQLCAIATDVFENEPADARNLARESMALIVRPI